MSIEWKPRGGESGKPYRARRIRHEANTSIEYGEKTWTTAQTVRDLMQNHLDAETERYYEDISAIVFDNEKVSKLDLNLEQKEKFKASVDKLLYSLYLFAAHVGDMSAESRSQSVTRLRTLSAGLPIKDELLDDGRFEPEVFLEKASGLTEHLPAIIYKVVDGEDGSSRLVSYEALRDEPLYQEKAGNYFRFQIMGVKIADHGTGYDSQLSSLYLSSKTGKRHLRGKFGEGAKMSELHLLRNGAKVKMRSQYVFKDSEGEEVNRQWRIRPKVRDGRLVSEGVEVERSEEGETGSMIDIDFADAKPGFKGDFQNSIDPRVGGLENNIAEFGKHGFVYPMAVSDLSTVGVDLSGSADFQYVQGIRVELASDSFGSRKPWFSYNFLDSSIIAGRDRNEINAGIEKLIREFWRHNDNSDLIDELVYSVIHDKKRRETKSIELNFLNEFLATERQFLDKTETGVRKIIDEKMVHWLGLKEGEKTLVLSQYYSRDKTAVEAVEYARRHGYKVVFTEAEIVWYAIGALASRISPTYQITSLSGVVDSMKFEKKNSIDTNVAVIENKEELDFRKIFLNAVDSVNSFMSTLGIGTKKFGLRFTRSVMIVDGYGEEVYDFVNEGKDVTIRMGSENNIVIYTPLISKMLKEGPAALQRKLEAHLISAYGKGFKI